MSSLVVILQSLLLASTGVEPTPQAKASPWTLTARAADFKVDTAGSIDDSVGAAVRMRAQTPAAARVAGIVIKQMPTSGLFRDTVVVYGEMRLRDVAGNASVFISSTTGDRKLLDGFMTRDLKGTTDWTPFFTFIEVSAGAASIEYGLMLRGGGEMEVRGLKLDIRKAAR